MNSEPAVPQAIAVSVVASVYRYRLRKSGATGRKLETGAYHDWRGPVEGSRLFGSGADLRAPGHDLQLQVALHPVRRAIEKQLP